MSRIGVSRAVVVWDLVYVHPTVGDAIGQS